MRGILMAAGLLASAGSAAIAADAPSIVIITNDDGSSNEFAAGDTFVMLKGFTGIWDIRERMKKQHIKIGDPNARPKAEPVKD